jgi:hypothetical protein
VGGQLTAFENFQNLAPQQILQMLQDLVDQLSALGAGGVFDQPIPLINKSVSDLLDLGQAFLAKIGSPSDPTQVSEGQESTAQKLADFPNQKLAPNAPPVVSVIVTQGDNRFRFSFTKSFDTNLPFSFDLGNDRGLVDLSGSGQIAVHGDATVTLTLGLSTASDPTLGLLDRVFLDTTVSQDGKPASGVQVNLTANTGYDLDGNGTADTAPVQFVASVGPFSVHVVDGRGLIRLGLGAVLRDGTTTNTGDHKLTLREIANVTSGAFNQILGGSFTGDAQAIISLDGDANGVIDTSAAGPDARVLVAGQLTNLGGFRFDLAPVKHQNPASPLTTAEFNGSSFLIFAENLDNFISKGLLNFGSLLDGLKQFITWGQNLLGIDFLDFKLPFLGVSLKDGFDFFGGTGPGSLQ